MPVIAFPLDETHGKRHETSATLLWVIGGSGGRIKVGIIDTGINLAWLAENSNLSPLDPSRCLDFTRDQDGPFDQAEKKHGSRVAQYVALFAPNSEIYSLRVHGKQQLGDRDTISAALQWCAEHRISVVNLSLTFYGQECSIQHPCALCRRINTHSIASDMFSVVACGDAYSLSEKLDDGEFPALCPSYCGLAWGVASPEVVERRSKLAEQVEGGLSFTAARFSGGVALLRSALPGLDVFDLRAIIQRTCVALGPEVPAAAGFGRQSFLLAYFAGSGIVAGKKKSSRDAGDFRKPCGRKRGDADWDVCIALERIAMKVVSGDWKLAGQMSEALVGRITPWAGPLELALAEYAWGACLESLAMPDQAADHYSRYNTAASRYFDGAWPGP